MFSVTWRNADRVPGTTFDLVRRMTIRTCAALGCASAVWSLSAAGVAAEERSLKLYFGHTGERAIITFKRNGVFDPYGLKQLNGFLRDWRQNKTINMDPRLFDIVWEMYRRSGATDYINVVSGYRSPGTNAMLRTRSSGVAKESQHTQGKAIDFFIPGVKLATLRGLAMQMQGGGVGYYPTSGSPFVHVDVGRIRAWPRMSYQELARLFPDGKTLHIASDGRTLPGYAFAVAEYKRRGSVASVEIASAAQDAKRSRGSMLSNLFGDRDAKEQGDARSQATEALPAPAAKEATALVAGPDSSLALIKAPVPSARPPESILLTSLVPSKMPPGSQALNDLISDTATGTGDVTASADEKIPLPTFAQREAIPNETDEIVTASIAPLPDAIAALSEVPSTPKSGALMLLSATDHVPRTTFAVSYNARAFETANFRATATLNHERRGIDPCPPMTAAKSSKTLAEPC